MKVLGAAERAGAGVELLLSATPNRLGAGAEDDVVELVVLVELLAMKENAGFGAVEESAAFCPKVNVGFGASEVLVSLFSAGLPKVKAGGAGCSAGALGLPKVKPPGAAAAGGAGAASASLLAAPKTKVDGAGEAALSFFSSGFPKVNVGAAGSLPACKDPNVELTFGVLAANFGTPSLSNTEPFVVVVVLAFVDVVSFEDSVLSLFSCEEGVEVTEEEDVVVVAGSDVFSSGFDRPKVKPTLEELLSVLDDPVPNAIPPLTPNLKPEPAAGWSDFLSSLEETPNLKPSEELPDLNPDEAVVSLEVSDEEFPNGTPNLNPPDAEEVDDSEEEAPNLNPPDPDELSDVPNLKPPKEEVEEPKPAGPEVPAAEDPKEPKALGSMFAPGLAA